MQLPKEFTIRPMRPNRTRCLMLLSIVSMYSTLSLACLESAFSETRQTHDSTPITIFGSGKATIAQLEFFVTSRNEHVPKRGLRELINYYIIECSHEGINHDVAFAQMCLETNFLRFDGAVGKDQNNFAGIGAVDPESAGDNFPSVQVGVRAHIQHLKAYCSHERPKKRIVDPRFHLVRRGSAIYVNDLSGKWADDDEYGAKIIKLIKELRRV